MAQSSKPFRPEARQDKSAVKTIAGVLIALALLAASFTLLVISSPPPSVWMKGGGDTPRFYLSSASSDFDAIYEQEEGDAEERPLSPGANLQPGIPHVCPDNGEAMIRARAEEIEIMLAGEAEVVTGSIGSPRALLLVYGEMYMVVGADEEREPVEITAAGRNIAIERPAKVRVDAGRDAAVVEIFEGSLTLRENRPGPQRGFASGSVVRFKEDGGFDERTNALLPAPVPVGPLPGSVFLREGRTPLPVTFTWRRVDGAQRYRVEVADDVLFSRKLTTSLVADNNLTLADLAEGRYYWRVSAMGSSNSHSEPAGPWPLEVRAAERGRAEIPEAPSLRLGRIEAQSNLITIRGQTEPGAIVEIELEAEGITLPSERRVLVAPDGSFRHQQPVDVRGIITVIVTAYYRAEKVSTVIGEVRVDF